jgi:hypothetical protein
MPWPNVERRVITGSLRRLERYHSQEAPVCPSEYAGASRSVQSTLATRGDSDIVQAIAEHTALDDEVGEGLLMATTSTSGSNPQKPKTGRSLTVRQAAARAAVTASKKTGRPVDERVRKIANSQ